ncbi:MAG: lytic murein transglycosylase B, partial [Rubrivivax sp.]|nr:lytic murein transglycosylase B [Rubrivivax sp.]
MHIGPPRPPRPNALTRRRLGLALCLGLALGVTPGPGQTAQATPPQRPPPLPRAGKGRQRFAPRYGNHLAAQAFALDVSERSGLSLKWLQLQLAQATRVDAVRQLIMPPPAGMAKNWAAYRARFIEPQRINAGLAFWQANAHWLAQAEARWGVPPEIVVGIVGVETFYGRILGKFRILDALATLSFDFPSGRSDRSAFFRSELEAFFVLCSREGVDPTQVKGSYAGAMGLPQFMPSSVNRFAVDLDGDGHIRLQGDNAADVVGSVAHYLAQAGWQRGMATHFEVAAPVDTAQRAAMLGPDIRPSFTAAQMQAGGAGLSDTGRAHEGLLALVELQNGDLAPSFVAGTQNFYVVTRYNWSAYYAMA